MRSSTSAWDASNARLPIDRQSRPVAEQIERPLDVVALTSPSYPSPM